MKKSKTVEPQYVPVSEKLPNVKLDYSRVKHLGIKAAPPHTISIAEIKPTRHAESGERVMLPDGTIWEYKGISGYAADNRGRIDGWEDVTLFLLA